MVRMVDEEMEVIVDFCRRSRVVHARVTVEFATIYYRIDSIFNSFTLSDEEEEELICLLNCYKI